MTNQSATIPASQEASRYLPLLLILFAASGCSALIYEIVWYQLLQLAIGSTAVSLGFLLATFMGGLCLGSLGLPRLRAAAKQHPLRIYAALELGIGILGVLVLWGLPLVDRVYIAGAEHGMPGMLLRGFISAVCLLPPTILMGASLPAIVALDQVHAARRLVVGPAVRRQYRGRGLRLPARRLLPVAHVQHGGGHLLRPRPSTWRWRCSVSGSARRTPAEFTARGNSGRPGRNNRPTTPAPTGRSTSPSAFPAPARWAPK